MIYDGLHYGVFSDEVDHIIALVNQHCPLTDIEKIPCPICGEKIRVGFYPDGKGFIIQCSGPFLHITQLQQLLDPPDWWQERTIEVTNHLDA